MNKLELKTLKSKVANRVFWLIFVSACVPLITIFLISFNYLSEKLEKETSHQIYRESRALGLAVYDRLVLLESNLKTIENSLISKIDNTVYAEDEWLRTIFASLVIKDINGNIIPIIGNEISQFHLDEKQQAHIQSGNTVLIIDNTHDPVSLLLVRGLESNITGKEYLIGVINQSYLWSLGVYSPDIFAVFDAAGSVLYSSVLVSEKDLETLEGLKLHNSSKKKIKYWMNNEQEYAINGWSIFLEAKFLSENLIATFSTPKKNTFSAADQFKNVFPQTLIVTALLVALLSIGQIRKSLGPIEKLMMATKNIAYGIYNKPVEIKSGDEFEKLGDSFNDMMSQIDDQFRTLETLSNIDRLILSSFDKEHIIKTLIQYLRDIIEANHVCVVTIKDADNSQCEININSDDSFTEIESIPITVEFNEKYELEHCENYLLLDKKESRSYIKQQKILGDQFFLVFPVNNNDKFTGLICISCIAEFNISDRKIKQLRELANRAAVALSNAEWEEKLYVQAHYDSLTNLPNRFLFRDRLNQTIEIAKRNKTNAVVMFIDLDRFKMINDSLGHTIGDEVIKEVATLLLRCTRNYDTVARFGGDEFLIIIPDIKTVDITVKKATKVASRILERMSYPFKVDNRDIYITASIGITVIPKDSVDYETILMNADMAMYHAKKEGRNNYQFFSASNVQENLNKLNLENDLRQALAKEQLNLVYQPKIDLKSREIIGAECLIRWNHPQLGYISPDKFIHLAEEAGLISQIGYWVLKNACMQSKQWQDEFGIRINIAVNVSSEQFRQPDFYKRVYNIIAETGLPAKYIELEITESITIENAAKTISILEELRELGLSISIDDFGTGFSSLSYLQQFPIDSLKIDQSFIKDLSFNKNNISITNAIITLAHNLNLSAVAEGIETKEQFKLLSELDCDQIQGYYICNPLTSEYLVKFIKECNGVYEVKEDA